MKYLGKFVEKNGDEFSVTQKFTRFISIEADDKKQAVISLMKNVNPKKEILVEVYVSLDDISWNK